MSTVAMPAKLLRELEALPFAELDKLVPRILVLRARKRPGVLSQPESQLVKKAQRRTTRAAGAGV